MLELKLCPVNTGGLKVVDFVVDVVPAGLKFSMEFLVVISCIFCISFNAEETDEEENATSRISCVGLVWVRTTAVGKVSFTSSGSIQ